MAVRFAARRAAKTAAAVTLLALVPPSEFIQWSGVQVATEEVQAMLTGGRDIDALVLGARAPGLPGTLVTQFAGVGAGQLPRPVMAIRGGLHDEAPDRRS